ncbi:putative nucleoside-diphosphate-sugar epimerases [Thiobacillus denitrificans ATCC 25259]|uniref:Putative nucleoside-diphosphate-sugar epimerases n=1 Tax=Thiobacillus denitrificans (strain ATCC 25259 / T1) TaxID=292415 RepID=Q3SHP9_THIDA|nr:NAD(P)-dependent oxidoreductase [Thiobacillus denitrificans]AAZ97837.1 putative nucleoside-diphosphate-sugar epimerases [Thiobacillus denitrificans ATCC 25259]
MALEFTSAVSSALNNDPRVFLITGATGWLGRALTEMLRRALGEEFSQRVILYGSREQSTALRDGTAVTIRELSKATRLLDGRPALLFHFAFLTKDRVGSLSDQEYVERNREISGMVASLVEEGNVSGVMLASSGAVYDHLLGRKRDAAAGLYGRLKAEDESRFEKVCRARSVRLVAPRIFNLSGPCMNKFEAYALSAIIVDVLKGGPIRLRANKRVLRSYFYIGDLFELCMRCLIDESMQTEAVRFDTVGSEVVDVGELAERVRTVLNRPSMPIERPALNTDSEDRYIGDLSGLDELLSRYEIAPLALDAQIAKTADYIRDASGCC